MDNLTISRGNQKLEANIFNLPAGKTCRSCLQCQSYCYAKKAERMYPNVLPSRERNLKSSQSVSFVADIIALLKTRKNRLVRIHESGDFYSTDYVAKWFNVAIALPEYTFYAYTKRSDIFSEKLLRYKPNNFILIESIDGIDATSKEATKFDAIARVSSTESNCPAQIDKKILCGKHCRKCLTDKEIVFKKH